MHKVHVRRQINFSLVTRDFQTLKEILRFFRELPTHSCIADLRQKLNLYFISSIFELSYIIKVKSTTLKNIL